MGFNFWTEYEILLVEVAISLGGNSILQLLGVYWYHCFRDFCLQFDVF